MVPEMNIQQTIHDYIVDNILFGDGEKLTEEVSFQESGILDSTGFLELITFAETRFGIRIAPRADGTWDLVTLLTTQ